MPVNVILFSYLCLNGPVSVRIGSDRKGGMSLMLTYYIYYLNNY